MYVYSLHDIYYVFLLVICTFIKTLHHLIIICNSYLHPAISRGVDLIRVEYIPDNREDIQATVLRLKERVGPSGFVFTSGGIGPTHDDVTYEALASAFGVYQCTLSMLHARSLSTGTLF